MKNFDHHHFFDAIMQIKYLSKIIDIEGGKVSALTKAGGASWKVDKRLAVHATSSLLKARQGKSADFSTCDID